MPELHPKYEQMPIPEVQRGIYALRLEQTRKEMEGFRLQAQEAELESMPSHDYGVVGREAIQQLEDVSSTNRWGESRSAFAVGIGYN